MSDISIFPETTRIREAMTIINSLEQTKLKVILVRLAKALDGKTKQSSVFSEEERQELQDHFHLSSTELNTFLGGCSFILEQSSYHLVKPAGLCSQLQSLGMDEPQAHAFASAWEQEARSTLSKLRSASLGCVPTLEAVDWRVHVQASRSDLLRVAEPIAFLSLRLCQQPELDADMPSSRDLPLEFNRAQLVDFLRSLDRMQAQLDALAN